MGKLISMSFWRWPLVYPMVQDILLGFFQIRRLFPTWQKLTQQDHIMQDTWEWKYSMPFWSMLCLRTQHNRRKKWKGLVSSFVLSKWVENQIYQHNHNETSFSSPRIWVAWETKPLAAKSLWVNSFIHSFIHLIFINWPLWICHCASLESLNLSHRSKCFLEIGLKVIVHCWCHVHPLTFI